MSREHVFIVESSSATQIVPMAMSGAGLFERQHLEEWVISNPGVLGDDVMIVTSEYDRWQTSAGDPRSDRLDILGLESDGRLVVVELKRDVADRSVELQALKYAALVSRFGTETLIRAHADFRGKRLGDADLEAARAAIEGHVAGDFDADGFRQPRVVILASSFPETVTNTVVWLTENGIDITLIRYQLYASKPYTTLVVSQLWPPLEVSDFVLEPRRDEARATAARTAETRRQRDVVALLIEASALEPGTELIVEPDSLNDDLRTEVADWLAEEPARARATWTGDPAAPVRWLYDDSVGSPSRLARRILREAAGLDRQLRGPRWFRTADGRDLTQVAEDHGLVGTQGRDWSDLHGILDALPAGRWTTYGDLATVIGSAAQPIGNHISVCTECVNAHRVLRTDGAIAEGFAWTDPNESRTPREILEQEGVSFSASGKADPARRFSLPELAQAR